jgi:hypothetical protein
MKMRRVKGLLTTLGILAALVTSTFAAIKSLQSAREASDLKRVYESLLQVQQKQDAAWQQHVNYQVNSNQQLLKTLGRQQEVIQGLETQLASGLAAAREAGALKACVLLARDEARSLFAKLSKEDFYFGPTEKETHPLLIESLERSVPPSAVAKALFAKEEELNNLIRRASEKGLIVVLPGTLPVKHESAKGMPLSRPAYRFSDEDRWWTVFEDLKPGTMPLSEPGGGPPN